ncbi:hypothetical protein M422DRAFT_135371, partial [Sphaerobolus stellatus SS14]
QKRLTFENLLDVPQEEHLEGDGWVQSFSRAYGIKEFRRHGEAASVDLTAVKQEQIRVAEIVATFALKDRFNFDETSLFPYAPPDRGLATQQMSGKKTNKFRITLGVGCNADGSEKLPLLFIGKAVMPHCFKGKKPQSYGFDYHNNTKAWMTVVIFEQWLKKLDIRMRAEGRKILLLVDNFSGHKISFKPKNIQLEFFEPNLTSFVQPCDAGIIRYFKAHYHKAFCLMALEKEEAGERDIYKINQLEGMLMARAAWDAVSQQTITNCWNHTKIQ